MSQTVTLRRAAILRNRLFTRLSELKNELRYTQITVNVFDQDVSNQIKEKSRQFDETLARFTAVSNVLMGLRSRIADENVKAGIDILLTEQAALNGVLSTILPVSQLKDAVLNDTQISSRLTGAAERAKSSDYANDQISFVFVTDQQVQSAVVTAQNIRSRLDDIQDQLEAINASHKIELTDIDLSVLQNEHLI